MEPHTDTFQKCLSDGAEALGLSLAGDQIERFSRHRELILRWGEKMNLTTIKDPEGMAEKLFLDSAMLSLAIARGASVCDVGSGAGFPGLVLLSIDPTLRLTMLEARRKKVSFLESALRMLSLSAEVRWERLGWTERPLPTFDEVVSRATFPPEEWLRLGAPLVKPAGRIWVMLGPSEEAEEGKNDFSPPAGFSLAQRIEYRLPRTDSRRRLVSFQRSPS
ncbi:MAG: 16S rRNA (guanine(527)-N(7))-methyltransferase RsmG [Myxococcales bacterium]|nr:16S rRNA (guanine(527)-N(7))-methyltransferase RsmG [Myxococcales bacterium]